LWALGSSRPSLRWPFDSQSRNHLVIPWISFKIPRTHLKTPQTTMVRRIFTPSMVMVMVTSRCEPRRLSSIFRDVAQLALRLDSTKTSKVIASPRDDQVTHISATQPQRPNSRQAIQTTSHPWPLGSMRRSSSLPKETGSTFWAHHSLGYFSISHVRCSVPASSMYTNNFSSLRPGSIFPRNCQSYMARTRARRRQPTQIRLRLRHPARQQPAHSRHGFHRDHHRRSPNDQDRETRVTQSDSVLGLHCPIRALHRNRQCVDETT
jgi:hypothetical protein